jgi:hypothetical protein
LEAFPVVDEAVLEYAFGVAVFSGEGVVEVHFYFFACGFVDLDVLSDFELTDGAMMSGLSLPAKPILVLSDPTSMMRGMP